jgi:hypothetical protein
MPESVLTQTMPLLFAGGVCCCAVGVPFSVAAGFDEVAGALDGAGAVVGAGLELELALDELDEAAGAEPEAGCEASADVSDFFVRFFLVVVALESLELSALAAG